jgi:hypothetical protein
MVNGTSKRCVLVTYIADCSVSGLGMMRSSRIRTYPKSGDCGFSRVSNLGIKFEVAKLILVCTQWGYFMPAPLDGPTIVSKQ